MNGCGKSDGPVIPAKPTNKVAVATAEPVEERGSTKGVTFGGKWQVLPELPGRFDGIIWQGDRRGGRMVDELERMLEIDLWLLRWCKVDGFVRCSVGGAGAAPL